MADANETHGAIDDDPDASGLSGPETLGAQAARLDHAAGARIGRYRLIEPLGAGGQAQVYLAEDTVLGRKVALKLLPRALSLSAKARKRFLREAEAASRLDHPHICTVYETGDADGVPFIAMQYVSGFTLGQVIERARQAVARRRQVSYFVDLDASSDVGDRSDHHPAEPSVTQDGIQTSRGEIDELLHLIEQVAYALHTAHGEGLVHRDIKPANIMVSSKGHPVILDFGLAHDPAGPDITQTGDFIGTPSYMPPEQIQGDNHKVDRRSDVYSLGVTLYEALALQRPFEAPTRERLYQLILTETPPDARIFNPAIPRDLKVVLDMALEKSQSRRYQTTLAFAQDLERVRRLEPILARPAGVALRGRRWIQRNPAVAGLALIIFLLLSGGLVFFAVGNARLRHERNRANRERDEKTAALTALRRYADKKRLELLAARADALWPAFPENVERLERWLEEAREIVARRPIYDAQLAAVRTRALAGEAPDEIERRDAAHAELAALRARLEGAQNQESVGTDQEQDGALLEQRIKQLARSASTRRSYRFADDDERAEHELLAALADDLDHFTAADDGVIASVEERIRVARLLEIEMDRALALWQRVIADVAQRPVYRSLVLEPQMGLTPLGPDPHSDLEEFAILGTGTAPARDAGGELLFDDDSAAVLVLLPGTDAFRMGAQPMDESAPDFDHRAHRGEWPTHVVSLAAFFIGKHELTQGQWYRWTGANPSNYAIGADAPRARVTARHPVEGVRWSECRHVLAQLGLVLPTEAQWEYAARSGTRTAWASGDDTQALDDFANLADEGSKAFCPDGWAFERDLDDGYVIHAPVGSLEPTPWGLHDVHGNVWEFCQDGPSGYDVATRAGDGLRLGSNDTARVIRGGSYYQTAEFARSAARGSVLIDHRSQFLGVRAARRVTRSR